MNNVCTFAARILKLAPALVVAVALPQFAMGRASVTLSAVADNTIFSDNTSNSNGAGVDLYAGKTTSQTNPDFAIRRALIRFDLSSIPAGSTITAVSLKLNLNKTNSGSLPTKLHRLTASWGEGTSNTGGNQGAGTQAIAPDATWLKRTYNTTSWTTAGGDFVAAASATTNTNNNGNYTWSGATMVADCQGWLNNSATNFGWIIRGDETTNGSAKRYGSRTNATAANRPALTITYTPPAASGACCAPDGTCQVMTSAACTSGGGTYQGNGTDCSPNPCPQPDGACCANNGACTFVTAAQCSAAGGTFQGGLVSCASVTCAVILTPFQDALPIPSVATPNIGIPPNTYDMYIREFDHSFHASLPTTRVWGYNSQYPGPTFEVRKGQPIHVTWHNDLRGTNGVLRNSHLLAFDQCLHGPDVTGRTPVTVTHLHGLKTDPVSDGAPDGTFGPGFSSVEYDYPNDQQAATLWYHDHALGLTRLNVMMGLAGFYLIRDDNEDALNIPRGEYEIPMVIQDRTFKFGGGIVYNPTTEDTFFGDTICVNGKAWPYLNVKKGKYRFRLLNGSNTRTYTLSIRSVTGAALPFQQIGSDGGLLNAPVTVTSITIMPGERTDVVVDFAPLPATSFYTMTNSAPAPFPTGDPDNVVSNVMRFNVGAAAGDTDPLPATLNSIVPIPQAQASGTKSFTLRTTANELCNATTWLINDLLWDDITDFLHVGDTEIWSFVNRSAVTHPMHVHLVQFQILDRQDFQVVNNVVTPVGNPVPPPAVEAGWKDTVQCPPSQITRVIARYEGYYGLFPMHCHILEHEDHEMMRQFQVLCDPPSNIIQPLGNLVVNEGAPAQLTLAVLSGDPDFVYQWRKNNVNINNGVTAFGTTISGATTNTLTLTNPDSSDNGAYDCRITNPCGHPLSTKRNLVVVPSCPGDINHDGQVNTADLTLLLSQFGANVQLGTGGDINADGTVNTLDLTALLAHFGIPC